MTFRLRDLTTIPSGTPDVQIFFNGQLLMRSEDGATCEVGVNPIATNHVLTIEVRTKVSGKPDLVRMRHVGPLNFRQREGMLIEVIPPVASPAAWSCRTFDPINYKSGEKPPPDEDFRWILNLEGPLFHRKELNPPIFNSHHLIRLQSGEYFFQTAIRANSRFDYERRGGGIDNIRLKRIGAVASASVFLAQDQGVVLRWQAPNREGDHTLRLEKAEKTTHEIYINNAPLFEDPPENNAELEEHDELIEYYKVIPTTEVPVGSRFQLVPTVPADHVRKSVGDNDLADSTAAQGARREAGSPDIPCQAIVLDGPNT